jgi:predicted RNA binding protein YcfA (HicA-like mRNA interferase family)
VETVTATARRRAVVAIMPAGLAAVVSSVIAPEDIFRSPRRERGLGAGVIGPYRWSRSRCLDPAPAGQRKAVVRALEVHIRGSHHYLRRPEAQQLVCVPVHGARDLPLGTLRAILRQAGLSADELAEYL